MPFRGHFQSGYTKETKLLQERANKLHKKVVNAWAMYDWANSAFATTIMAAVLPPFYSRVAGVTLPGNLATVYWGYTSTIAMLLIAVLAPILGAIADHTGGKKKYLASFMVLGVLGTMMLYFVSKGNWFLASALFVVGNLGFAGGNIFYDSLLPHVARADEIDQVSTRGYAFGYLGGGLLLAINLAWIMMPHKFGFPNAEIATRASFVSVGVWWLIFSYPILKWVPEPPHKAVVAGEEQFNPVVAGFRRLGKTFHEIRKYRELVKFIIAFWVYNDGIGTIIKMATIYGAEIGIGETDLIGALLMTQFVGIPFTFLFGGLAKKLGAKNSIFLGIGVYTLVSIEGYFMSHAWQFWVLAFVVGMVQGGTQALSRSLYGAMVPKSRSAEFFGFYNVSSKFAGIAGPLTFAVVGQLTGSSRLSIISLVIFFIVGAAALYTVDEKEGIAIAAAEG